MITTVVHKHIPVYVTLTLLLKLFSQWFYCYSVLFFRKVKFWSSILVKKMPANLTRYTEVWTTLLRYCISESTIIIFSVILPSIITNTTYFCRGVKVGVMLSGSHYWATILYMGRKHTSGLTYTKCIYFMVVIHVPTSRIYVLCHRVNNNDRNLLLINPFSVAHHNC